MLRKCFFGIFAVRSVLLLTLTCRFQAVMSVRGQESIFKILEINDFKQLPHITLAFRPGNDAIVKQVRMPGLASTR